MPPGPPRGEERRAVTSARAEPSTRWPAARPTGGWSSGSASTCSGRPRPAGAPPMPCSTTSRRSDSTARPGSWRSARTTRRSPTSTARPPSRRWPRTRSPTPPWSAWPTCCAAITSPWRPSTRPGTSGPGRSRPGSAPAWSATTTCTRPTWCSAVARPSRSSISTWPARRSGLGLRRGRALLGAAAGRPGHRRQPPRPRARAVPDLPARQRAGPGRAPPGGRGGRGQSRLDLRDRHRGGRGRPPGLRRPLAPGGRVGHPRPPVVPASPARPDSRRPLIIPRLPSRPPPRAGLQPARA